MSVSRFLLFLIDELKTDRRPLPPKELLDEIPPDPVNFLREDVDDNKATNESGKGQREHQTRIVLTIVTDRIVPSRKNLTEKVRVRKVTVPHVQEIKIIVPSSRSHNRIVLHRMAVNPKGLFILNNCEMNDVQPQHYAMNRRDNNSHHQRQIDNVKTLDNQIRKVIAIT